MENLLRDNVSVFGFGRPPSLAIFDPSHPLFGRFTPPIGLYDPNDPFFIPQWGHIIVQLESRDPNIPSIQLGAPIPPKNQPIITQSLVQITP